MKATHVRLLTELCKALNLDVPDGIVFALGDRSEKGDSNSPPKDGSTKPGLPSGDAGNSESPPKN